MTKIATLRDEITADIQKERHTMHGKWLRHGLKGREPNVSNKVVLRMTHRLRILADLPNMVDLIGEEQ